MSTSLSTNTKKYPRSILAKKNCDQSRAITSENVIQNNLNDENTFHQLNPPSINYTLNDNFQNTSINYLNQSIVNSTNPQIFNSTNSQNINSTISNQPIYESQVSYNPSTNQHEQQIVTCEQYYNNLNNKENLNCFNNLFNFKLTINGWKFRLLVSILFLNVIMCIVNAGIIIWIISFYYLSINGVIDFKSNEIVLKGDAHFEKSIQLNSLSSIKDEQLRIRSNNIIAQDIKTQSLFSMFKTGQIIGLANEFILNDKKNETKMMINDNQFFLPSDRIIIDNDHQLNLGKSIQTKQLNSKLNLNIISLNRKIKIETSGSINLKSKNALNLINNSTEHLQLITRNGKIYLNSSSIEITNLRIFDPTKEGTAYPDIYQLCICTNGKLFTDSADGQCITNRSICSST